VPSSRQSRQNVLREIGEGFRKRWRHNLWAFIFEQWGVVPWELPEHPMGRSSQADVVSAIEQGDETFISWAAGQKTGKSFLFAATALWWSFVIDDPFVFMTAPTGHQLNDILWRELVQRHGTMRFPLGGRVAVKANGGLKLNGRDVIVGRTPSTPHDTQGISGPGQLSIVDEASGVGREILEAIQGNTAGGGMMIIGGNPLIPSGPLYDSQTTGRGVWAAFQSSSPDNPNFHGGSAPGLAAPKRIELLSGLWGEGTPAYEARIMGRFPSMALDTVISLGLVDLARNRLSETKPEGFLLVGIDPAGFGDDWSVIYFRRGLRPIALLAFHGLDGPDLAGKFLEALVPLRGHVEPVRVNVDVTGEGASCFDALVRAAQDNGLELNGVNFGAAPTAQPTIGPGYANLATQMWFELRAALEGGAALPDETVCSRVDSAKLEGELVARKYGFDLQGRLCLERKKDMKARIGRSPDRADACVLAHYQPPAAGHVAVRGQRKLAGGFGGF
jgi:phage terminase large subunit